MKYWLSVGAQPTEKVWPRTPVLGGSRISLNRSPLSLTSIAHYSRQISRLLGMANIIPEPVPTPLPFACGRMQSCLRSLIVPADFHELNTSAAPRRQKITYHRKHCAVKQPSWLVDWQAVLLIDFLHYNILFHLGLCTSAMRKRRHGDSSRKRASRPLRPALSSLATEPGDDGLAGLCCGRE